MTLQQLRYLIAVAEYGSINAAAQHLYASQSNLSTAMKELEKELGINIFRRSNRGVTLTNDGTELLNYARQIVEQADLLEARYKQAAPDSARLAVSTQHYSFAVEAFIKTAEECASEEYELILRETSTAHILDDVKNFRSDIGVVYTDNFNTAALWRAFDDAHLMFYPLFEASVHIFVNAEHPLARKKLVQPGDLAQYPRYSFEQGADNSFYFSEEPLAYLPRRRNIRISDRGTLTNLLLAHDGYTISTGLRSPEMSQGVAAIPLGTKEKMKVGYLVHEGRDLGDLQRNYIANMKKLVAENESVTSYVE